MAAKERIIQFISKPVVLAGLYTLLAIVASLVEYNKPSTWSHTSYNNYTIFKQSFFHLIDGKDLYLLYSAEQSDLFKYTPAFALFFGVFAYMPDWLGLCLWNLLNALVLFSAINATKILSPKQKAFALLFIAIESMTSMQSAQSNGLIAGLMIWAYNGFESEDYGKAALFIALAAFIKPFGIVVAALFLLYPKKIKFLQGLVLWGLVLAGIPLLVIGSTGLVLQYKSWLTMLNADHAASVGYSVAGWLQAWFNFQANKMLVTLSGIIIFCTAYIRLKAWNEKRFQLLMLCSALIWVVIFNHKAESPTFIIAVAGVALWYFNKQNAHWADTVLVLLVFIFTILSPTDLFPTGLRSSLVIPYQLKVLPCILVWTKIVYEQVCYKPLTFARQ